MTADGSCNTSSSLIFYSCITNCSSSGSPLTSCLQPWNIATGVVIAISCLLGIPTNIAVIVKLSRHLHGSSISQRLFFNLALSDLLCLLVLLVGAGIFFNGPHLTHGLYQLLFYFFVFCITSSLNIRVLISIQRYYQVLHHEKWNKVNRTWQRLLLFTVWMTGALVALPVVFLLNEDRCSCKNQRIAPVLEAIYIVFIVFSHAVLLSFYLLLVRGVNHIRMADKKKPRVTKLFIRIIAASLVVGCFPLILRVVYVTACLTASHQLLHVSKVLTFLECFYFFNHCLNPFLYFFASRHQTRESSTKRKSLLMPLNDSS